MAAQLAHESSSGLESAESTTNRHVRIVLDPMQDGIGKHCIEFVVKDQCTNIHYPRVKTAVKGGFDHVRRTVNAHYLGTCRNQFLGQCSVTATQIEDAFTGLRLKQIKDR